MNDQTPMTFAMVAKMVAAHHQIITRQELSFLAAKTDAALTNLQRDIHFLRQEHRDVAHDVRVQQNAQSRLTLVIGGWPTWMDNAKRHRIFLEEVIYKAESLKYWYASHL